MTGASKKTKISERMYEVEMAFRRRDVFRVRRLIKEWNEADPDCVDGWVEHARLLRGQGDYTGMLDKANKALQIKPECAEAIFMKAEAFVHLGEVKSALSVLDSYHNQIENSADLSAQAAQLYTQCGAYELSVKCARNAFGLMPEDMNLGYNLATSLIAVGKLVEAEEILDQVIAKKPWDYDAYYNRANLRKQTWDNNHIASLEAVLASDLKNPMGSVQLNYALAKELEDIGEYEKSFAALKNGADTRRKMLAYQVSSDTDAMDKITEVFNEDFFEKKHCGYDTQGPVFILGFPRSGTTLVDRILSAHPDVESLGELTDFAMALTQLCKASGGKAGLIEASANLEMQALGKAYMKRALQRSAGQKFFIDKTPANFLYIGLIAAALPNAKIIHLNRNLADVGLGMYKTLFRMGYPFSYDLDDLAKYMQAKEDLMAHWRKVLPGKIIDIHYEDIIAGQEVETRKLLQVLDLDWHDACLDFHKNKSPSATASAAQVRKPIYTSAVNRWKHYEAQLAPLTTALGIM